MAFIKSFKLPEMVYGEDPKSIDLGDGFKLDYEIHDFDPQYDNEIIWREGKMMGYDTTLTVYDDNDVKVAEIPGPDFTGVEDEDGLFEKNRVEQENAINDIIDRLPEIIEAKMAENEKQNERLTAKLANQPKDAGPGM